jgi:hypothetical protein
MNMTDTIKGLLAKAWKDEEAALCPGTHYIDEEIVERITGFVEKQDDQMITPTVSVPLISVLALFWEKAGIAHDQAMKLLREAIIEAMDDGVNEDGPIKSRIDDVTAAISAVRTDLLAKLPKMPRTGRTITKGIQITVSALKTAEIVA